MEKVMYTQEEVNYREDLLEKLLTLDHVRSILIGREDSANFIAQIDSFKEITRRWMQEALELKRSQYNVPAEQPEETPEPQDE